MGRRALTLSDTQLGEVETLAALLTAEQMADYFGIGRATFFAMMSRDERIAERYNKGKERAIGAIAQSLITKARAGDTASMIFYLKTQAGWRETERIEHTIPLADAGETSASERLHRHIDQVAARLQAGHDASAALDDHTDLVRPEILGEWRQERGPVTIEGKVESTYVGKDVVHVRDGSAS
jgi:hypothetical protein